ncbi:MAG: inositol monophosphatase [Patescibacteria group bacterium]|nr:inositol monophosphatase [Patescibacteria group bacterium]
MDTYSKIALRAARAGGRIFKKYFGQATGVREKKHEHRNLVTDADLAIEKIIRARIARAFPEHHILGEEFGGLPKTSPGQFIWLLDPIDGTNNFAQGLPLACISIGLWDHKGPLVSVVYNPVTESLYTAERGKGAKLNGKAISVSKIHSPMGALGGVGWTRSNSRRERAKLFRVGVEKFAKARALGTTTLQMCFVADAKMDFYFGTGMYIWDIAAAALIITEAGGKVTDVHGKPLTLLARSVVASNGKLHNYIIKNLR